MWGIADLSFDMVWQENIVALLPHVSKPIQYVGKNFIRCKKSGTKRP